MDTEGRLQIGHVVLESNTNGAIALVSTALKALPGVGVQAMQRQCSYLLGVLLTPGHHHAALARGHVLGGVETKATKVADRADTPTVILSVDGVGTVFNDTKVVASGNRGQRIHVARSSRKMNGNQSAGLGRYPAGNIARIEVHGECIDIGGYGQAAGVDNRIDRAAKGQRRSDDLISRFNTGCQQTQLECGRAGPDGGYVLDVLVRRKVSLELSHPGAGSNPARAQTGNDLFNLVVEYLRLSEYDKIVLLVLRLRSVHGFRNSIEHAEAELA